MRRTKIICTLGPGSDSPATISGLLSAGADVVRINLSHLTSTDALQDRLSRVDGQVSRQPRSIAVMLDTRGPELRTRGFAGGEVELRPGTDFTLTTREVKGTADLASMNCERIPSGFAPGTAVLLDDGAVELEVVEATDTDVRCTVVRGGTIRDRRKITVPGGCPDLDVLSSQDRSDLTWALAEDRVDIIALSFVRTAADVLTVRKLVESQGRETMLVAKIECAASLEHLEEILRVSDGLMVARGDLGVELSSEEVPLIQKRMIALCNRHGKPVITATQMLESMIHQPVPTRAEASDVANAIFDGTDAIMLSGETAIGEYPIEAVQVMDRIARRTEQALDYSQLLKHRGEQSRGTVTDAISYATCSIATSLGADGIITATQSGHTARVVARYRPRAPIIAVTPVPSVARKLALVWGVLPVIAPRTPEPDRTIEESIHQAREQGPIRDGDLVVITAGVPVGVPGTTNLIRVHTVGNVLVRGKGIGDRSVTGRVVVARTAVDAAAVATGDVLVTYATDASYVPAIQQAGAVITEQGGLTSHAAIVGLEVGCPVIVGAGGAVGKLEPGQVVTVDPVRGVVYRGEARV